MFKVTIIWARTEKEETNFDTKEKAQKYIEEVAPEGSNIKAFIEEV